MVKSQGIEESRIIKEDQSRHIVENPPYSMEIVDEEKNESVTPITSASHMRRALMLFLEADKMNKISSHIVYMDCEIENNNSAEKEKELILRDFKKSWIY